MRHGIFPLQLLQIPAQSHQLSDELNFLLTNLYNLYSSKQYTSEELKISQTALGMGGNSTVFLGSLHGREVAVKISEIDAPLQYRVLTRGRIFRDLSGINNLLLPIVLYIDKPNHDGIGGLHINASDLVGYLYEVYHICQPYKIPTVLHEFLYDLKLMLSTILQMHHRKIAHLDLKLENMMYHKSLYGKSEIKLTDLSESQYTRPHPSQVPLSTTTTLITRNEYIRTILNRSLKSNYLLNKNFIDDFLCEFQGGSTLKSMIMHHTPPQGYRLIDTLMFGIFLLKLPYDIAHMSLTTYFTNSPSHTTLKSRIPTTLNLCGKKLILSAFQNLYSMFWHSVLLRDEEFSRQFNILSGIQKCAEMDFLNIGHPIHLIDLYNIFSQIETGSTNTASFIQ